VRRFILSGVNTTSQKHHLLLVVCGEYFVFWQGDLVAFIYKILTIKIYGEGVMFYKIAKLIIWLMLFLEDKAIPTKRDRV
jgi:hypothetical protein